MKIQAPAGFWESGDCICPGPRASRRSTEDTSVADLAMELPSAFSVVQRPILRLGITTLTVILGASFSMRRAAVLLASTTPALLVLARTLKIFNTPRSRLQ